MSELLIRRDRFALQLDGHDELILDFLEERNNGLEVRRNIGKHKGCPPERGLNGNGLEGAGVRYRKKGIEANGEYFGRLNFAGFVVQQTNCE